MNFSGIKKLFIEERAQTSMELIMILGLVVGVTVTVFVFIKSFAGEEIGGRVGEEIACGDGLCTAPETASTCPLDCA